MGERAGTWIRVSSGAQDEENQVPDILGHCGRRGYEIVRKYELNDKSAWKGEQETMQQAALADLRSGAITVLVCWASDRLERRGAEAVLRIFRLAHEAGGRIEAVEEPFLTHTDNGDGELMLAVTGWKDRQESRRKAERVRIARDRIKNEGGVIGRPPFGYVIAGPKYAKKLLPAAQGRALIPELFGRVGAGQSLREACRWLESVTGRPWWPPTVSDMIRNPVYRGRRCNADGTADRCEPLVGALSWQAANDALDATAASGRGGRRPVREPALLTGTLRCIRCDDSPMYRILCRAYTYYRCTGKGAKRAGCGNMIPLAETDALMSAAMAGMTSPVVNWQLVRGLNHAAAIADADMELRELAAAGLSEAEEDARRCQLRAERRRLQSLPAEPDRWLPVATGVTYAQLWARLDAAGRRGWLAQARVRAYAGKPGMESALYADSESTAGARGEYCAFRAGSRAVLAVAVPRPG